MLEDRKMIWWIVQIVAAVGLCCFAALPGAPEFARFIARTARGNTQQTRWKAGLLYVGIVVFLTIIIIGSGIKDRQEVTAQQLATDYKGSAEESARQESSNITAIVYESQAKATFSTDPFKEKLLNLSAAINAFAAYKTGSRPVPTSADDKKSDQFNDNFKTWNQSTVNEYHDSFQPLVDMLRAELIKRHLPLRDDEKVLLDGDFPKYDVYIKSVLDANDPNHHIQASRYPPYIYGIQAVALVLADLTVRRPSPSASRPKPTKAVHK